MNYLVNEKKVKNITCLMIGKNIDYNNKKLKSKIKEYKLDKYIFLLGQVKEIYKIYNILDIHILTSYLRSSKYNFRIYIFESL